VARSQTAAQACSPARFRREWVGELVQVDGCEHWWFEDRGPQCTLLVFIDDATGRVMTLRFVESESTFAYFRATLLTSKPRASRWLFTATSTGYFVSIVRARWAVMA
jgi:hypothetical protein